ncbi:hypothetical protein HRbin33_01755 [bacterium HR33]|nr:hypothetical protein HRbin33_01755 [bacterium HR33]
MTEIALGTLGLAAAWLLRALGVEPIPTWFYVAVWYPTLLLLDGAASTLGRDRPLLGKPKLALSLFAWSPVIWLVFEAINFRLEAWYYVFLPRSLPERWTGIMISFATVIPAVVLAARFLESAKVGARWQTRPLALGLPRVEWFIPLGIAATAAALIWPRYAHPLVWGSFLLVADPIVYRKASHLSILADLERGYWGRTGRLMLGGLGIGLLWELYNHGARGKWIYTVPWLEEMKWFEMPPLGFLGFPFFALEAWSMYHALAALRVAVPVSTQRSDPAVRPARGLVAGTLAAAFSVTVLWGMERQTISSTVPHLETGPAQLTFWEIARSDGQTLSGSLDISPDSAIALIETAKLAALRGIGLEHAAALRRVGVETVCQLAARDPRGLWTRLRSAKERPGKRPTEAEVRVWVRAARRECQQ